MRVDVVSSPSIHYPMDLNRLVSIMQAARAAFKHKQIII